MWCCSKSAEVLFNTVLGFGGTETISVNSDNNPGTSSSSESSKRRPDIIIDSGYMGSEVVIIKNGLRLCGTGGALGSAPLVQTKSYFEVKIQQEGKWSVGVGTRNSPLDVGPVGADQNSWMLRHTGELFFNGLSIGKLDPVPEEGDVIVSNYLVLFQLSIVSCNYIHFTFTFLTRHKGCQLWPHRVELLY